MAGKPFLVINENWLFPILFYGKLRCDSNFKKRKQMYKKIYTSAYVSYSCIVEVGNKAFFCCFSALNISVPNSDGAGKADDFFIFIGGEFSGKFRIVRKISARCILIHNADINGVAVFSIQKTENIYGIVRMSR